MMTTGIGNDLFQRKLNTPQEGLSSLPMVKCWARMPPLISSAEKGLSMVLLADSLLLQAAMTWAASTGVYNTCLEPCKERKNCKKHLLLIELKVVYPIAFQNKIKIFPERKEILKK